MFDYAKLFRDLSSLDTDFSKFAFVTSLIIGLIVGLIMACVVMLDTLEFCNNIWFRVLLSCFGFIASTAVTTLFFTFAISFILESKPVYDLDTIRSIASENGVESLDNFKYNVDYLIEEYYSSGLVFNTRESEYRYNYKSYAQRRAVSEIDRDEYVNSILNKFYLDTKIASYVNSLIDNTELSYESVYKELKK
jgi:hypothetical protein